MGVASRREKIIIKKNKKKKGKYQILANKKKMKSIF